MKVDRNKNQNYSDIQAGETLFDFLKRKKKVALEVSLSKSRQKQNINTSNIKQHSHRSNISPHKKYEDTYRQTLRESALVPSITKYNQETNRSTMYAQLNTLTPKRVSLGQQKQKRQSTKNSFIELISPIKRKYDNSKTPECQGSPQSILNKTMERHSQSKNSKQVFYRRNLNNSISTLKSALQKFMSVSGTIKQKSHTLLVQLKPLLKLIQESSNPNFAKRAQQARIKLQTFEHLLKQIKLENGGEMIEQFHRSLSQHLLSLQSNIKSNFEKEHVELFKKMKQQKDSKIQSLLKQKENIEKESENINRRYQKLLRQTDNFKLNSSTTLQRGQQNYNSKYKNMEEKIKKYELQINTLRQQLDKSKDKQKQLLKSVKDYKYLKQQAEKRFIEQNVKIKSSKQQFLLNEITILKKQFKNDMQQLTILYSTKQKENMAIIQQLKHQIAELHGQRTYDKGVQNKILEDTYIMKSYVQKTKKQNQCLVTDLHRMNQQLYQHWLALKDIKTLTVRLQIYNKFSKIYDELAFNDLLFA